MFNMVVFAILKNPSWAQLSTIPAPKLNGGDWEGTFPNRTITLMKNFNKDAILEDFFETMKNLVLVEGP